ncbi:uncharacterized protein BO88DRAFT_379126 [Aspergillus vadensis CBS 113365]|uniref:Uncharacterized protein n=1 Tax=Aspergillus vadensis (strain CBS 113365 / IMI 142717 / IBT 24658) TaxID=1448311 RepID=A0A319BV18_ASPVC|nr:hypothetical protein BO88DRAFT_379126 [Aspergillus vadensis CBS 113365]PYH75170.1 hypothetical protein BO88DRAFT_379126 [Aspergillus vadensis CBS 113365]
MNSIPDKTAKNPVTAAVTVAVTDHVLARAVYTLISVLKKPVAELIRTGLESVSQLAPQRPIKQQVAAIPRRETFWTALYAVRPTSFASLAFFKDADVCKDVNVPGKTRYPANRIQQKVAAKIFDPVIQMHAEVCLLTQSNFGGQDNVGTASENG